METPKECSPEECLAISGNFQNLPQDLITETLLRLPVKSIGRFKCVSKPWRSFLSSPSFVKAHLKLHSHEPGHLIFTKWASDQALYTLNFSAQSRRFDSIARALKFSTQSKIEGILVLTSCNGLVLLRLTTKHDYRFVLMNPVTSEAVEFPGHPNSLNRPCTYGMGFDSSKDDYSIVSIFTEMTTSQVHVYSVKMKIWRRCANFPHTLRLHSPAIFLHGRLHYWEYDNNFCWVLASFDIASEEFGEVPLPSGVERYYLNTTDIRVLDGRFALTHLSIHDCLIVWAMEEYGVQDSWSRFAIIRIADEDRFYYSYRVLSVYGEDEIVMGKERPGCRLVSYNRRDGVLTDMVISKYEYCFLRAQTFRESLVS